MTWAALNTQQRIAKVRQLEAIPLDRTTQATRLGLTLQALSQFCSANGLTAANTNTDSEWADLDDAQRKTRILELREDDGMSMRQIAVELGVRDHSTIRSFCQRNGMETLFERRVRVAGPPMVPARPVDDKTWALVGSWPVTMMELNDHTCKWPVGTETGSKQLFCGCHSVADSSYCEVHALMARGSSADA